MIDSVTKWPFTAIKDCLTAKNAKSSFNQIDHDDKENIATNAQHQVVENNHGARPDNQITTGLQLSAFSAGLQLLSWEKNCCDDKHCLKTPVW